MGKPNDTAGPHAFHYDYVPAGISNYVPAGISNMKYPSGRQVATTYNQASQPNGLTGYAFNIQYAPHGALQQLQLGNGVKETWTYNSRLQPTAISAVNQNTSANLLTLGYGYSSGAGANGGASNNVGNVVAQTITPGASSSIYESYAYDHFDRLTVAAEYASFNSNPACPDGSAVWYQQFSAGTYGNVLTTSVNLGIQSPAGFDANNHNSPHYGLEISTSCSASNSGWCYDNAGNLTRDSSNQTFGYNADGQMVAVCPSQSNPALCTNQWNAGQVVYTYDAEGKRVQSHMADGTQVVYVYDAAGQLAADYGGTNSATGTQYLTADPLGSTRMVSASVSGSPCATARMDFLPYGFVVPSSFSNRTTVSDCGVYTYQRDGGVRQKFAGSEHDSESGLDFFGARYMSSAQGRFTSPDAVIMNRQLDDPQLWNKYAYVGNRPLTYIDPDGKWPFWIHNRIIEEVFGRTLDRADRRILQTASAYVDRPANQDAAHAYQHGMSNALIGQSPEDAHGETQLFIMDQVNQAVQAQISAEGNHPGVVFNSVNGVQYADPYAYDSMFHLGEAVHAATDMYSPTHSGAQPWSGNETAGQLSRHVWGESKPFGNEYAEYLARVEAARVYQLYQKRLEEERKRKQQQQEQENQ